MSCCLLTPETWASIVATSTTSVFLPTTEWIPCTGLDTMQAVIRMRNAGTYIQISAAYQTAEVVTTNPDAPATVGNALGENGAALVVQDISATTASKTYIRFGLVYSLSSASTPETADVSVQVSYRLQGRLLGSFSQQFVAPDTSAQYLPIGDWVSTLEANKVKGAFVVSGAADFGYRLAYQTAESVVESPGAWTVLEADWVTTYTPRCSGQLTLETSGKMWIRFAIGYQASSGSNKQAYISGALFVRS